MVIDNNLLDELTRRAKNSPRLRMNFDMPIHRHMGSSETCLCVRGHFVEYFYNEKGNVTNTFDMLPGGLIISVPIGQWHNLKSLESGTVLFECKDGAYEPLSPADILTL